MSLAACSFSCVSVWIDSAMALNAADRVPISSVATYGLRASSAPCRNCSVAAVSCLSGPRIPSSRRRATTSETSAMTAMMTASWSLISSVCALAVS